MERSIVYETSGRISVDSIINADFAERIVAFQKNNSINFTYKPNNLFFKGTLTSDVLIDLVASSFNKENYYYDKDESDVNIRIIDEEASAIYELFYEPFKVQDKKFYTIQLKIHSSSAISDHLYNKIKDLFKDYLDSNTEVINVNWYFSSSGGIQSRFKPQVYDINLYPDSYPYIPNLENWVKDYVESDESILVLIGPPGTGKTNLIKYIINQLSRKYRGNSDSSEISVYDEENDEFYVTGSGATVYYTSDREVYYYDEFYIRATDCGNPVVVIEDADYSLVSRKESESLESANFVEKLLGVSDGLIDSSNIKIILSTNLEDITDIDPALLREGRCYDVVRHRLHSLKESKEFLEKRYEGDNKKEIIDSLNKDKYSLAELYRILKRKSIRENEEVVKSRVGFK